MTPENLAKPPEKWVCFDLETFKIEPGILAPTLVCGAFAWGVSDGTIDHSVCPKSPEDTLATFRAFLASDCVFVGHNICYDFAVIAVYAHSRGIDLLPAIFSLYRQGRVYDTLIAEQLHAIGSGTLGKDPRTGMPLKSRYSLETCVDIVLNRTNAKSNDRWRKSYALLAPIPIEQWPEDAKTYPLDDVVNTLELCFAQLKRNINLHDLAPQCYAAWCMHLGAIWGFKVDPEATAALRSRVETSRAASEQQFIDAGIIRPDGTQDQGLTKRLVATAFGCTGQCPTCGGTGKVPGKSKKPINCKTCSATGFDLTTAPVPRTETGGVQISRDACQESGDELLMSFAAYQEDAKIVSLYLPLLESGATGMPITLKPNAIVATGRASYGDGLHSIPRAGNVRECFIARGPTYKTLDVAADYVLQPDEEWLDAP